MPEEGPSIPGTCFAHKTSQGLGTCPSLFHWIRNRSY